MIKKSVSEIIEKYSIPIKEISIDFGLIQRSGELLFKIGFGRDCKVLVVSDQNLEKYTNSVIKNLNLIQISKLTLEDPYTDQEFVDILKKKSKNVDLIVAVGSGTINDLCKIASYQNKIPYVVFATAPSMNGYASANASISVKGHKKSLKAHQAMAIYFDLEIISNSPIELIKSGIGDSLCYWSCYFDWALSNLVLGTEFNQEVFDMLAPYQDELVNFDGNIRDKEFMVLLCKILIISGFMMYICKGSHPASQGEHLIAHFLNMKYPNIIDGYYHGSQISVTTKTMMNIQRKILKSKYLRVKSYEDNFSNLNDMFGEDKKIVESCLKEISGKIVSEVRIQEANKNFSDFANKMKIFMISGDKFEEIYDRFNLLREPEDIGINSILYKQAVANSNLIRNRLTALDFEV